MGAHLVANQTSYVVRDGEQIEGDSLRCPFHGWRYGPDGKCNDIPYSPNFIPKNACVKSWPVVERAGAIWMWHDEEGGEPDVELPAFAEWDDQSWVRWKFDIMGVINTHPQEIVDNMADLGHMVPVHGSLNCAYFDNEFDGPILIQRFSAGHRTLADPSVTMRYDTWYTGPGILQSRLVGNHPSLMLIAHTPIEDGVIKMWHALMVKSPNETATDEDVAVARAYQETSRLALAQDLEIWNNKRPCINPMQIPADGPFGKVRIWYKQFYNSRTRAEEFQKRVNGTVVSLDNRGKDQAA